MHTEHAHIKLFFYKQAKRYINCAYQKAHQRHGIEGHRGQNKENIVFLLVCTYNIMMNNIYLSIFLRLNVIGSNWDSFLFSVLTET